MKTFDENAALKLMRAGKSLVRTNGRRGVRWYVGDGQVSADTAQKLITRPDVTQLDPGLFADFAQSYVIRSQAYV
jgi:hypothetical protein